MHLTEAILVADKRVCVPWCYPTKSANQRSQGAKWPGPFTIDLQQFLPLKGGGNRPIGHRCAPCPMRRIARRDAPCRVNRFSTIKCINLVTTRSSRSLPVAGSQRHVRPKAGRRAEHLQGHAAHQTDPSTYPLGKPKTEPAPVCPTC